MAKLTVFTDILGLTLLQGGMKFSAWNTERAVEETGTEPFQITVPISAVEETIKHDTGYLILVNEKETW
jgi:hypothetical protein